MPANPPINFKRLRPSRSKLAAGDIFAMRLPHHAYLFGRIVRTDAQCFAPGCVLVYVFRYRAAEPEPPPALLVKDLLIPPATINRLGWSRGYLMNVGHRGFEDGERLPVHYFEDTLRRDCLGRRQYVNEDLEPVGSPPRGMLVGEAGLGNYRTLDDAVSQALGIRLAPD